MGHVVIEIGYAASPEGRLPIAYALEGATAADIRYIQGWLSAMQTQGHSADAFLPRG